MAKGKVGKSADEVERAADRLLSGDGNGNDSDSDSDADGAWNREGEDAADAAGRVAAQAERATKKAAVAQQLKSADQARVRRGCPCVG